MRASHQVTVPGCTSKKVLAPQAHRAIVPASSRFHSIMVSPNDIRPPSAVTPKGLTTAYGVLRIKLAN